MPAPRIRLASLLIVAIVLAGCAAAGRQSSSATGIPRDLLQEARPIGASARFHPSVSGPLVGPCRRSLGPRTGVHVELFAANRVVLVPAGIGARPPWAFSSGRISAARCYGDLITLEPTGLVLVRRGAKPTLSELFGAWGQPLSRSRLASFLAPAGTRVAVFVDGRRWRGLPGRVPLATHSEIVLEVGPYVPPHASYTFPPGR
jgi:hypothetical protein